MGSKFMQRSVYLEMFYGYQVWSEESLTRALCIAGVKGHVGVILGPREVLTDHVLAISNLPKYDLCGHQIWSE